MHCIHGFLATPERLNQFAMAYKLSHPCAYLEQHLGFFPLNETDLHALSLSSPIYVEGFTYLSEQLMEVMAMFSRNSIMAYVETDYFGGAGEQGAVAYTNGVLRYSPRVAPHGPINDVLHLFGVFVPRGGDAFEAVGLGKKRTNEDYLND